QIQTERNTNMLLNLLSEKNKIYFAKLELLLANIDGNFNESEKRIIEKHCAEMGITPIEYDDKLSIDDLLDAIQNSMSIKEKKIVYIELLTVALIDNEYHKKEQELIDSLRQILLIPESVAQEAYDLVSKLIKSSLDIESFIEW
ncbi:MAG: TerB family tellurite resistance protein, partial [Eubacterium sp.]|nr:TerB family tellurite resistance protein [Eubacterium sp.]